MVVFWSHGGGMFKWGERWMDKDVIVNKWKNILRHGMETSGEIRGIGLPGDGARGGDLEMLGETWEVVEQNWQEIGDTKTCDNSTESCEEIQYGVKKTCE